MTDTDSTPGANPPVRIELTVETPEAMAEFGAHVGRQLRAGDIVALDGELGAGKTTFTRGLGEALGVRGAVTSPTFVLARTHPRASGEPPLVHVDAYRLGSPAELDDLDIDVGASIVVIEWAAGMIDGLSDSVLNIRIERPTGGDGTYTSEDVAANLTEPIEPRSVTVIPTGDRWRQHPFRDR